MSSSPRAAIVGVAESELGRTPDKTVLQLQHQAARAALLQGARGQMRIDLSTLSEIIHRISTLAFALGPRLSVLEINPLLVNASRIEALDVLISWQE